MKKLLITLLLLCVAFVRSQDLGSMDGDMEGDMGDMGGDMMDKGGDMGSLDGDMGDMDGDMGDMDGDMGDKDGDMGGMDGDTEDANSKIEYGFLSSPTNVVVDTMSSSVLITWDMVDEATGYKVEIENVTSQTAQESRILISGLMPSTMYSGTVRSMLDENISKEFTSFTFTTSLAGVQNLMVSEATETEIVLTWDAAEGADAYVISYSAEGNEAEETRVDTVETNFRFTALTPMTFYKFSVSAEGTEGMSDMVSIRARTDGSGVEVNTVFRTFPDTVVGGQILVFRPLVIPKGSYSVEIDFGCPIDPSSINIWNADVTEENSDFAAGIIVATQRASWQRAKPEIGMIVNVVEGVNCTSFDDETITPTFEIDINDDPEQDMVDVPSESLEWVRDSEVTILSAGLVRVQLMNVYRDVNEQDDDTELPSKPGIYDYIIVVRPGAGCASGLLMNTAWSMTLKETQELEGAEPGVQYFVQEDTDWYSNEAGFIYGYDPENCSDRSDITAQIMVGGEFVKAVVNAPDAEKDF